MMNRLALNILVRVARTNPTIQTVAPCRWQSSQAANQGGSNRIAAIAGGLTVLVGGLAWYQLSGARQVISTTQTGAQQVQKLKEQLKDKDGDAGEVLKNLRSASATLIPGSAPFLGKVFDQLEEVTKEHGDDFKKIVEETYNDLEKLTKQGTLDPKAAGEAVEVLQKHFQKIQDIAGDAGNQAFNKIISDNSELRDQISKSYNDFQEVVKKVKEKKPQAQQLLKETGTELVDLFKGGDFGKKNIEKARDILKKKSEEAKKLVEDVKSK